MFKQIQSLLAKMYPGSAEQDRAVDGENIGLTSQIRNLSSNPSQAPNSQCVSEKITEPLWALFPHLDKGGQDQRICGDQSTETTRRGQAEGTGLNTRE